MGVPRLRRDDERTVTTVAFHKPYGVLSRFTPDGSSWRTLSEFGLPSGVWPVGRLDADSEGLLLLSSDKALVNLVLSPRAKAPKTYHVQVERIPDEKALAILAAGIVLDGTMTRPARVRRLVDVSWPPREPPVRFRKSVPDCWIELVIHEGRNRQVRRMTAAVGHPTLRLVRVGVGNVTLNDLSPGGWRPLDHDEIAGLKGRFSLPARETLVATAKSGSKTSAAAAAAAPRPNQGRTR